MRNLACFLVVASSLLFVQGDVDFYSAFDFAIEAIHYGYREITEGFVMLKSEQSEGRGARFGYTTDLSRSISLSDTLHKRSTVIVIFRRGSEINEEWTSLWSFTTSAFSCYLDHKEEKLSIRCIDAINNYTQTYGLALKQDATIAIAFSPYARLSENGIYVFAFYYRIYGGVSAFVEFAVPFTFKNDVSQDSNLEFTVDHCKLYFVGFTKETLDYGTFLQFVDEVDPELVDISCPSCLLSSKLYCPGREVLVFQKLRDYSCDCAENFDYFKASPSDPIVVGTEIVVDYCTIPCQYGCKKTGLDICYKACPANYDVKETFGTFVSCTKVEEPVADEKEVASSETDLSTFIGYLLFGVIGGSAGAFAAGGLLLVKKYCKWCRLSATIVAFEEQVRENLPRGLEVSIDTKGKKSEKGTKKECRPILTHGCFQRRAQHEVGHPVKARNRGTGEQSGILRL